MKNEDKLQVLGHSLAHILMQALMRLYGAVPGVGPAIENGFYHDFDSEYSVTESDLPKIEKEMKKIIREDLPINKKNVPIDGGIKILETKGYGNTLELAKELKDEGEKEITFYEQGDFTNMCKGPHLNTTGEIDPDAFKLTKVAGAYWKGNEKNKMLQRIYGVAFETKEKLDNYLELLEEAARRDHRKLGKELDLFSFHEEGPGFPFWHTRGTILYSQLENFIRKENEKRGYKEVKTPIILNKSLWVTSGHWDKFKEDMYFTEIDKQEFSVKPMNCPGGMLIYKERMHSYRDLPARQAEFGLVHRHELSGVLHGLLRVRSFTQDDAHSFCTPEQLNGEIIQMVDYAIDIYKAFGFNEYEIFIATKPEKHIGEDDVWEKATSALINALKEKKLNYKIKEGEGAFYGPKIEFNVKDAIGRNWQLGTIQVDFSMPQRFETFYIDNKGNKQTPVMIHRAILGSLERFIGILIEHYVGAFPLWLSPVQTTIIPVSEKFKDYAKEVHSRLLENEIRVEISDSDETLGKRIREAEKQKIPYILVVGEKEMTNKTVNVRARDESASDNNNAITLEKFIEKIKKEILDKK